MDDYDYFPEGAWPSGNDPYGGYPDPGAVPPTGRRRDGPWPPGYAPPRVNGTAPGLLTGEWRAPGHQPQGARYGRGRPPDSGPRPAYRPAGSGPVPAYQPQGARHGRGRPPDSGPRPAYPPAGSGPMPAYQPQDGRHAAGNRLGTTTLLAGSPHGGGSASSDPLSDARPVLGWLPFSNRLVLLPKSKMPENADEELREHRDISGGWLRPAVFGAMDGLVTNSSLIAGIGGGGGGQGMIVLTGIAGLIAGAFSMATGEYISVKSQNELTAAEVELERKQHARDPAGKQRRLAQVYVEKGVSPNLAEAFVRQISADPDQAVVTHVREELGIDPDDLPSPRTAAIASFASFTVGALIPLSPFLAGYPVLTAALAMAGAFAFAGGAAVAKLAGRSVLLGGLRQFTAAFLATGMAFFIGHLVGGRVS